MRALLVAHWPLLLGWVLALSIVGFAAMGADKKKARRGDWRIPEKSFFIVALLGGAAGTVLGMHAFHHKTRHWYFRWGLPAILVAQLGLLLWIVVTQ